MAKKEKFKETFDISQVMRRRNGDPWISRQRQVCAECRAEFIEESDPITLGDTIYQALQHDEIDPKTGKRTGDITAADQKRRGKICMRIERAEEDAGDEGSAYLSLSADEVEEIQELLAQHYLSGLAQRAILALEEPLEPGELPDTTQPSKKKKKKKGT
jgi:hypothetical protein